MAILVACQAFAESHSTLLGGEEVDALEGVLMDKWEPTSMQVLHHTPCCHMVKEEEEEERADQGPWLPQHRVLPKHISAMTCPGLCSEKKGGQGM